MRRRANSIEGEGIADHLCAGVLSAIAMLATVMIGAFFAAVQSGPDLFAIFRSVLVWGTVLAAAGFLVGLLAGPSRMATLYGHLWGTAEPRRPFLSLAMWSTIALVIGVTYLMGP